ncbi:MAG: cyclic nucleotide-binding domain-containing protein, partial [Myxococcales bacterium]|nr:cyclic nucleotide-binding domain-containing protein [Myxococcales bacterium]
MNEDSFLLDGDVGLYAVADGMSGRAGDGGREASKQALEAFHRHIKNYYQDLLSQSQSETESSRRRVFEIVRDGVQYACQHVNELANESGGGQNTGTTLTSLLCLGNRGVITHVGHSRIYLLRNAKIYQLTEDHTFVQEQIRQGVLKKGETSGSPLRNVLTRALGPYPRVQADIHGIDLLPGDRFLISTDGYHSYLKSKEIKAHLSSDKGENIPQSGIDHIVGLGMSDDTTIIAMFIEGRGEDRWARQINQMISTLSKVPLFQDLNYSELVRLMDIVYLKSYAPEEVIFHENNVGDGLYVVVEGVVEISQRGVPLVRASTGNHFGEIALCDKKPRSATVAAMSPFTLLSITR